MAGMLASAVLNLAGAKLASAVEDQVLMQWKLEDDLEDMKGTLKSMEAVLKDAERRSIREESVLLWLKRLKNAAYDISDMLDDFQDGKARSPHGGAPHRHRGVAGAPRPRGPPHAPPRAPQHQVVDPAPRHRRGGKDHRLRC